jgi:hypothetical protein
MTPAAYMYSSHVGGLVVTCIDKTSTDTEKYILGSMDTLNTLYILQI